MKRILIYIIPIIFTLQSCEDKFTWASEVDCSECKLSEPSKGELTLDITINSQNTRVPITIFRGDPVEKNIISRDTTEVGKFKKDLSLDVRYTIMVKYKSKNRIINAVDGTTMKSYNLEGECNINCWIVRDKALDMRLKF